jgi:hypothetical protein
MRHDRAQPAYKTPSPVRDEVHRRGQWTGHCHDARRPHLLSDLEGVVPSSLTAFGAQGRLRSPDTPGQRSSPCVHQPLGTDGGSGGWGLALVLMLTTGRAKSWKFMMPTMIPFPCPCPWHVQYTNYIGTTEN